ncbi:MAG: hypothetical protein ABR95_07210 [Sphingobacteriales bacterium BACL12 MAG-120813-bin55]|jgi:anti-sigma B factor antagonist|nr:MAG: hypothetical protein ABR94_11025 [Sphingobacteriales bacterium BACL12 MAG-120802-bin5]KRP11482.1 MAG: hypothetical protein ABR95_07210 [Sphingobacteriales bacterium BACL12 MAG-120813-bin55]
MEYSIERTEPGVAIIRLKGRIIGEYQLVNIRDEVEELVETDCIHLIFDLSELEFMNSSGLSFFLKVLTLVRGKDGEVVLVALNRLLDDLMVTTKLNSFFLIEPGIDDAMEYLKQSGVI